MERTQQILEILTKQETYITASKLASLCNVSTRTIRTDLNNLNQDLAQNGATIQTIPRKGIRLDIHNNDQFNIYLTQLQQAQSTDKEMREHQLLEYLIMMDGSITIDELADVFYVSRSTIKKDLKVVREHLNHHNIQIDFRANQGIKLIGDEKDLRICLAHFEQNALQNPSDLFQDIDLNTIHTILLQTIQQANFQMSQDSLNNLITHIAISIVRIQADNVIHFETNTTPNDEDYILTLQLVSNLEQRFHLSFPQDEIAYIYLHLSAKKMLTFQNDNVNAIVSDDVYKMVNDMLTTIYTTFKIDLRYDMELISLLALHIVPFKVRLLNDLTANNPLTNKIRSHYALAYNMAVVASKTLKDTYHKNINKDEIAYMALHFNVALEKKKNRVKENILIVCGSGRATSELLAYRIKEKFGDQLNVVKTTGLFNIETVDFNQIDYILTTIPIQETVPVPIIEVNSFLEQKDEETVSHVIQTNHYNSLTTFFRKDLFFVTDIKDKQDLLTFLVEQTGKVIDLPENFLQAVLQREDMKHTAFGNLVAIPHPIKPMGKETFVSVAILDEPILWDEEDVQIVFLLSMKESGGKNLETFYKVLAKIISNKEYSQTLIDNKRFEDMEDVLKEIISTIG